MYIDNSRKQTSMSQYITICTDSMKTFIHNIIMDMYSKEKSSHLYGIERMFDSLQNTK